MSTYTQIYYHIVFSTKNRDRVLSRQNRENLFRYIWGIIQNKKSQLYQINGVEDHLHILTSLHPSMCLADFVKDIKTNASIWIKDNNIFPGFSYWQDGYGAFTHSTAEKKVILDYIKEQIAHHKEVSFKEELRMLLIDAGVEFNERYLL